MLGGGRGLAVVLEALRDEDRHLTVIVSIAYEGEQGAEPPQRLGGRTAEDLRRSLEALSGEEEEALLRAIRRPLSIERLGRQPLGNLVIASVAGAFGDYGTAAKWLGEQLGVAGSVLPATTQPLGRKIEVVDEEPASMPPGGSGRELRRLVFASEQIATPAPVVEAIEEAHWVLLAPGSLYQSVLATAAVPDVTSAMARTEARVVWIANLTPDAGEMAGTVAIDHLRALRLHGVRVDAVLHDPAAALGFDAAELERFGMKSVSRALLSSRDSACHDAARLRAALQELIGYRAGTVVGA